MAVYDLIFQMGVYTSVVESEWSGQCLINMILIGETTERERDVNIFGMQHGIA